MTEKKPHVHAELIKAWADGAEIEYFSTQTGNWKPCPGALAWFPGMMYRIKPEPKVEVAYHAICSPGYYQPSLEKLRELYCSNQTVVSYQKITYVDGKPVSIELIDKE